MAWFGGWFGAEGSGDVTAPAIENIVPTPDTPIARGQLVQFDIVETALRRALPSVLYQGAGAFELIHDGVDFAYNFKKRSTRTEVSPGRWRYIVGPNLGWPSAPQFYPFAFDTSGNETP